MPDAGIRRGLPDRFVEQICALHADYYTTHWRFGAFFVEQVRAGATTFVREYDSTRDGIWSRVDDGRIVASISIDGSTRSGAHLRWFIVDRCVRGRGLGRQLLHEAVGFCRDQAFDRIYLTTFAGLDPARHLYEQFGFSLVTSERGNTWGVEVTEQRFELLVRHDTRR